MIIIIKYAWRLIDKIPVTSGKKKSLKKCAKISPKINCHIEFFISTFLLLT